MATNSEEFVLVLQTVVLDVGICRMDSLGVARHLVLPRESRNGRNQEQQKRNGHKLLHGLNVARSKEFHPAIPRRLHANSNVRQRRLKCCRVGT
jgi:hypothetical protein